MRALLAHNEVTASPGQPFSLGLEVSNTEEVIDSVSVSVSGLPGAVVKTVSGRTGPFPWRQRDDGRHRRAPGRLPGRPSRGESRG